ncbi:MAG: PASTA domain-containing protein, partial [Clostridia bacterium]|nr:PASTA domain-containing protein [Clostridia bacterium]
MKDIKYINSKLRLDRKKFLFMILGYAAVCLAVAFRIFFLQVVKHEKYKQMALDQMLKDTTVTAKRGTIYDANLKVLAKSATVWTVAIDPSMLKTYYKGEIAEEKTAEVCKFLSETLELDYEEVNEKAHKSTGYEVLKKQIELDKMTEISNYKKEHKCSYIIISEDNKRYYPYETLASTVLGFVNKSGVGGSGIECQYDSILSGTPGRIVAARDGKQGEMPFDYEMMIDATSGSNLVLTIDETVQHYLEKALRQACADYGVQNGASGIIMDCNTGAILGMASLPDFDPNQPYTITDKDILSKINAIADNDERQTAILNQQYAQWRNKSISDTYEPGSVFKPLTASACLEEGVVSPSTSFTCAGSIRVANIRYNCHKHSGHGTQSLTKGMMNSCNPFFISMGQRLGSAKFIEYFEAFGLTEKTGIDLPGESNSQYHAKESFSVIDLASNSFGQAFNVTPIQLITAFATTVNGGYLVQPHLVSRIIDDEGNIIESYDDNIKRQVISGETSKLIASMLESVVSDGTGKNGYLEGYRIGGKTGTSEKINESKVSGEKKYVASFCGVAPADDPQIVILIALDEPSVSRHTGGQIAAPTVRNVLQDVLPYLGIEPVYSERDAQARDLYAPNVVNEEVSSAKSTIASKGLQARVIGNGTNVVRQIPASGNIIPKGGTVIIYTDNSDSLKTTVPDFSNMTPAQANQAAAAAYLNIRFAGTD